MEKSLHSTHILMFPFLYESNTTEVNEKLMKSGWIRKTFDPGANAENYSEYIYFYEYVRKALYQLTGDNKKQRQVSYYFEYHQQEGEFAFTVNQKTYTLQVAGVSMRTFNTHIGILSIELRNYSYYSPKEILLISDFARRTYPQFLGKEGLKDVQNKLLPEKIVLKLDREIEEDFSYFENMQNVSKDPTYLPKYLHELLGTAYFSSLSGTDGKIYVEPVIDDRMFVISLYMNDALADKMKVYDEEREGYHYEDESFWYEYVFVDGTGKTCQSRTMTRDLIRASTYDRWVEWGTLYGISRYSFVALTGNWYGREILEPHMRTMYYQIFTLLLAYRASILSFSYRVSKLILRDDDVSDYSLDELRGEVSSLYKDYINFQNNLFFREVTAQEQGIEIYQQAMEVMQIEKQIKDLDSEIAELHTYVAMKTEEERNSRLEKISELGAVFLPPALLSGIFGINSAHFANDIRALGISLLAILLSGVFGFSILKVREKVTKSMMGVLLLIIMLGTPWCLYNTPKSETYTRCATESPYHSKGEEVSKTIIQHIIKEKHVTE